MDYAKKILTETQKTELQEIEKKLPEIYLALKLNPKDVNEIMRNTRCLQNQAIKDILLELSEFNKKLDDPSYIADVQKRADESGLSTRFRKDRYGFTFEARGN